MIDATSDDRSAFRRYFLEAWKQTGGWPDHEIRATVHEGDRVRFYIHPSGKDGPTRDFLLLGDSLIEDVPLLADTYEETLFRLAGFIAGGSTDAVGELLSTLSPSRLAAVAEDLDLALVCIDEEVDKRVKWAKEVGESL